MEAKKKKKRNTLVCSHGGFWGSYVQPSFGDLQRLRQYQLPGAPLRGIRNQVRPSGSEPVFWLLPGSL